MLPLPVPVRTRYMKNWYAQLKAVEHDSQQNDRTTGAPF